MNLKGIKNIIFDLGIVILNVDLNLTIEAFRKLGAIAFDKHYTMLKQDRFFDDMETGKISGKEFRNIVRGKLQLNISDEEIDKAWNKMLLDLPAERLMLMKQLKKQYRLFLLSNTNEIHLATFKKIIKEQHDLDSLHAYFEKEYYSHIVGRKKPDPAIFKLVLKENQLKPEETLFVDDTLEHIEGAKTTGLATYHLKEDQTITEVFNPIS